MRLGELLTNLGRPVAYYPNLARVCGGVKACLVLCQLAYWHGKQRDPDGWIEKGWPELEEETGLSRKEQRTARSELRCLGLIEERVRGVPPTTAFRLNFDRLEARLYDSNWPLRANQVAPSGQLNGPRGPNNKTETTTETTPEISYAPLASLKKPQDPTNPLQAADATVSKEAAMLIAEINRVGNRTFSVKARANLAFARARLADYPLAELLAMVRWRWRTWDEGMRAQFFRPETLLNATKCESYLGSMPPAERATGKVVRSVPRNAELDRIAARDRELGRG